jgi:tRNA A-37 threonylcarbamoyl transferase component Bud32
MLTLGATKGARRASLPISVTCKKIKKGDAAAVLRGAAQMSQFGDMVPVNVVRIVGMVTKGSPMLLLLEFCDHGSLDTFLTQRIGMSTADKLNVMGSVADGMAELEAVGFVHGNLCTRNVLVAEGG